MKKTGLLLVITSLFFGTVLAQDATVQDMKKASEMQVKGNADDTIPRTWKNGGIFNLTINQGSLSNWAAGGDKFSFSLNAYAFLYSFYKKNRHSWDNSLDLAFGMVKTTSLGQRKASDRIDLLSKYGYALNDKWNLSALFNLRTQFADGFAYSKTADGRDSSSLISRPFSPAYILLSPGVDYKPTKNLSIFLSPITARWVIAGDDRVSYLYDIPAGKNARSEFGAFASINFMKKFGDNLSYKTRLDFFSNYRSEPQNIDIFWTNVLTAKITRYINVNLNVDMIYDDNTANIDPTKGPAPQWMQLLGIGFAYSFNNAPKVAVKK